MTKREKTRIAEIAAERAELSAELLRGVSLLAAGVSPERPFDHWRVTRRLGELSEEIRRLREPGPAERRRRALDRLARRAAASLRRAVADLAERTAGTASALADRAAEAARGAGAGDALRAGDGAR